jgi:hypothetical protein
LIRTSLKAKTAAKANLRSQLLSVTELSRALETDAVKMPHSVTEQSLINAGRAVAGAAESLKKDFVAHGLSPEFGAEIAEATSQLERAALEHNKAKELRTAAIRQWNAAVKPLMKALRRLDALVHNALKDEPGALAAYEVARAVAKTRRSKEEGTTSDPTPDTTTAAAKATAA